MKHETQQQFTALSRTVETRPVPEHRGTLLFACADAILAELDRHQRRKQQERASAPPGQATIAFQPATGGPQLHGVASNPNLQAALAAAQAAAGAAIGGARPVGGLLPPNVLEMQRRAAEITANARKRSKWDSAK